MRRLVEIGIFALVFTGIILFVMPTLTDPKPPIPTVKVDGGAGIPVAQGSYCWSGLFKSQCVDMVSAKEIVDVPPVKISPGAVLLIHFDKKPVEGSLDAEIVKGSVATPVTVNGSKIIAPTNTGIYLYVIHANWEEGSSSYAFSVKVE